MTASHARSSRVLAGQQGYQMLNCDDHAGFLRRHSKDPALYRPDICHQARYKSLRKGRQC